MMREQGEPLSESEVALFVYHAEVVGRLLRIADEASAAFSVGLLAEAGDALRRYHAVRTEHAETVDIRVLPAD